MLSVPHLDVTRELARLRKENDILRAGRDLLKSGRFLRPGDKPMRFRLIDAMKVRTGSGITARRRGKVIYLLPKRIIAYWRNGAGICIGTP